MGNNANCKTCTETDKTHEINPIQTANNDETGYMANEDSNLKDYFCEAHILELRTLHIPNPN